jgi:hypothetical protein
MKRSTLLVALMMTVAVLVPAAVANASHVAADGGTTTLNELPTAQESKAQMIAGYFAGVGAEEAEVADAYDRVVELRTGEPAMGWGVLSKLALYTAAGMDIEEFLKSAQDEDGGYSMGQLRKDYEKGYELGDYDELEHKNFGQMQKAEKPAKPDKADKKTPPGQKNKSKD